MKDLNETSLLWEHQSRIIALENSIKNMRDVSEDVAVIKNVTSNIQKNVDKLVQSMEKIDDRVTHNEGETARQGERIGIFAVGQTMLTILISSVVGYLKK